ncbi:MAG: tRNA lysidine(34) synthetase TilS, partial [Candidatus Aminicenantes bacterium RBG_16_66_30]
NGGAVEIRKDEGFPRIRTEAAAAGIFPMDTAAGAPPPPLVLEIASGYEAGWAGARIRVTIRDLPPGTARIPAGDRSAWFDADQFEGSTLLIRSPQPGDRIRLFGSGGRRKLSDIFIDRKVPRARRRRWPVITQTSAAGEEILWVVGIVRSAGAIVTGETRRVVQLEAFGLWK